MFYSNGLSQSGKTSPSNSLTSISTIGSFEGEMTDYKVKVDRKLLEKMLDVSDCSVDSAQDFFSRTSSESGAIISFPQKWKLEVLPKKEPEIRIIGNSSQVRSARKLIMDVMDPNKNRVILKIDVSFADHSFIIGKGGKRIQSIMSATQTQIHFPDENLLNSEVKSNVVTITSDSLRNVDEARQIIRQSLPLTVSFQVVVKPDKLSLLDSKHQIIDYYQRRYNVLIGFKYIESSESLVTLYVQIRGSRQHFDHLQDATQALNGLLDSSENGINCKVITITIEISGRHQSFVMGLNNANIKAITNRTATIISFPDQESNGSSSHLTPNSSTVTIKGMGMESAFMAWIQILEFLPVVLLFDIKEEQIDSQLFTTLMSNQLLAIKICPKINSEKRTLILKTEERNINLLFEARKQILNIREQPKPVSISPSALVSNWNQVYGRLTSLPFIPSDLMDSETEVLRSDPQ